MNKQIWKAQQRAARVASRRVWFPALRATFKLIAKSSRERYASKRALLADIHAELAPKFEALQSAQAAQDALGMGLM